MTDRPEIKVGQRWVTQGAGIVRVLATDGRVAGSPVIVEDEYGGIECVGPDGSDEMDDNGSIYRNEYHLVSLAPSTVKREVALYLDPSKTWSYVAEGPALTGDKRISEPLTIEFTLLPGESSE